MRTPHDTAVECPHGSCADSACMAERLTYQKAMTDCFFDESVRAKSALAEARELLKHSMEFHADVDRFLARSENK